jgi:rod shape-determining protein MreC
VALWGVREENQRLRIDLQRAQADLVKYREAMANNVRLEKLLNLKNELDAPFITAQIVGRDPSQWFNTVIINQGTSDGVQMDMPVVSAEGVVGQVRNASPHFAKILLANDPNSAIDVLLQESRVQGIVKGNGKGFDLQYVLKNNEVNVGDTVLTSGMGGVFPKGLPLGTVEKVVRNRRGMFQQIEVTPAVNFEQLEYLVIILQEKSLAEEE